MDCPGFDSFGNFTVPYRFKNRSPSKVREPFGSQALWTRFKSHPWGGGLLLMCLECAYVDGSLFQGYRLWVGDINGANCTL